MNSKIIRRIYKIRKLRRIDNLPVCRICKKVRISDTVVNENLRYNDFSIKPSKPSRQLLIAPIRPQIDEWIKKQLNLSRKNRMTVATYYEQLKAEHPELLFSLKCLQNYVSKTRKIFGSKRGYCFTLTHKPSEGQADLADFFYFDSNGNEIQGQCFALSFPHSGMSYLQVIPGKSIEGVMYAMQNIFRRVGGVPSEIWVDNDSCFANFVKVNNKKQRKLTDGFERLVEHFKFSPIFMNTMCGHEKGAVESCVGYLRRNLLVPLPTIIDFDSFNAELLLKSEKIYNRAHYRRGKNIIEQMHQDKKTFLPLPPAALDCVTYYKRKCYDFGRVLAHWRSYFIDPAYVKKTVSVALSFNRCHITAADGTVLLDCPRLFRSEIQADIDWERILPFLMKRPHSLPTLPIVRSFPPIIQTYIATAVPYDFRAFVTNLLMVTKLAGIEKALAVSSACIRENRLKKSDFMLAYKSFQ